MFEDAEISESKRRKLEAIVSEADQVLAQWERENPMPPWPCNYWCVERAKIQKPYLEKMKALYNEPD